MICPEGKAEIRMMDATVTPKVEFISPFGTTICNVNPSNAPIEGRGAFCRVPLEAVVRHGLRTQGAR